MSKRLGGLVTLVAASAILAGSLVSQGSTAATAAPASKMPPLPARHDAKVGAADPAAAKKSDAERAAAMRPAAAPRPATWPVPGERVVQLTGASAAAKTAQAADSAIRLVPRAGRTAKTGAPAASAARLRVLDPAQAQAADVSGFLLTIGRADGGAGDSPADLTIDYSGFAEAVGGNWASRLELVALPKCALTTPKKPGCLTPTPVGSVNNQDKQTLTAPVAVGSEERVMAVTAASGSNGSSGGDYAATTLTPAASWSAGRNSGDFTWNYPLRVPPAPAGPVPSLSIDYSAQSVDGKTAVANNQSSWVGEGFDLGGSYIERKYASCEDDGQTGKYDLCWKYDNATLVLNGQGGELVKDGTGWRLKNDDGSKIEKVTNPTDNGDNDRESWKVTTLDGTQYYFGREHVLPNATDPVTNSVWTVPVAGDDADEPCHGSTFATSFCDNQAWRWNLDLVVDPHANAMSLWYANETNYYAKNGATTATKLYDRGGYLTKILYGQRSDAMSATAPMQVTFTTQERCLTNCTSLTATTKANWPDVPFDQICAAGATCNKPGPSFFSRRRLDTVTTKVGAQDVDRWQLTPDFPSPGDNMSGRSLWLKSITHTGVAPGAAAAPLTVSFEGTGLPNRVDSNDDGISPMNKLRVGGIWTETGAKITVVYSDPECIAPAPGVPGHMPASAATNTMRCYPVHWQPADSAERDDWFHRHVVTQIRVSDVTGGADAVVTNYTYGGGGAWHYAENPLVPAKERNWSEWRGFRTVTTSSGDPFQPGPRSRTVTSYFRGMNGDRASTTGGVKSVTLPDTQGGSRVDAPALAGLVREAITYAAIDSNTEVTGNLTDYWVQETATQTVDSGIIRRANLVKPSAVAARIARDAGRADLVHVGSTTYDPDTGLPTTSEDLGNPGTADDTCTVTSYAKNAATGLRGAVSRVVVSQGQCDATSAKPPQARFISDERTIYDNGTPGSAPTKGDVTSSERATGYNTAGDPVYQQTGSTTYDVLGRPKTHSDALGRTSTTVYTPAGVGALLQTVSTSPPIVPGDPNSKTLTTKTTYRPEWGAQTQSVDPNGKITDLEYDALGRTTAVWLPNQSKANKELPNMRYTYSLSATAPSYVRTDDLNLSANGYLSGFAIYDSLLRSRQTQTVAPNGGRLINETKYNSRGLPIIQNNDLWNSAAPSGALATVFDAEVPNETLTTYDGVGRVTESKFQVSAQPQWSTRTIYGGDTVTTLPPNGAPATSLIQDTRGRAIENREYEGSSVTPGFISTKYTYDAAGRMTQLTTAGSTWTYGYDLLGRRITSTDPDAGTSSFEYDAVDRPVAVTNANQKKLITSYDNLDRKTTVHEGSKTDANLRLSWDYDATGQLGQLYQSSRYPTGKSDPAYKSKITARNVLYKPTATSLVIPASEGDLAGTYQTTIGYLPDNETVDWTNVPGGGAVGSEKLNYTYNNLGRPVSMKSGDAVYANDVKYTATGDPERYELGDQHNMDIINTFEPGTRRLLTSTSGDVEMVANHEYKYDQAGNLLKDDNKVGGDAQCYKYDAHARLTDAWSPSSTDCAAAPSVAGLGGPAPYWQSWTYTASGLRQTQTEHAATGNTTETYTYDTAQAHTLKSITTTGAAPKPVANYTFDNAGNTTQRPDPTSGVEALTWSAENKLQKLSSVAGDTSYVYDADGSLILRKSPGETTLFVGSLELTLDTSTKTVTSKRTYSIDGLDIAVRASVTDLKWLVPDHHGTSNVAVDSKTLATTKRYTTPFGEARGPEVAWPDNHGFLGKPEDKATGLTTVGAREYDSSIGRFLSVDPMMDTADPHQMLGYTYGNNNPATISDPTGLMNDCDCHGGGGGGGTTTTTVTTTTGGNEQGTNHGSSGGDNDNDNGSSGNDNDNSGGGGWKGLLHKVGHSVEKAIGRPENPWGQVTLGIGAGAIDTIKGAATSGWQSYQCYSANFNACASQAKSLYTMVRDPSAVAKAMWEPIGQDFAAGNTQKASGRIIEAAAELLIGSHGAGTLASATAKTAEAAAAAAARETAEAAAKATAAAAAKEAAERAAAKTPKAFCSFAGATGVLMADGSAKAIKDIKPGDKVLATDPTTGERAAKTVLQVWAHADTLTDLVVAGGKVTTTEDHPFWSVTDGQFERADELAPGEKILSSTGHPVLIAGLAPETAHRAQAYNLTVAEIHTYYVLAGATPVLVHNAGGGDDFNQSMNKALDWLEPRGFKAERPTIGKFGTIQGKPIGMQTSDGKTGFRIEFDQRSGAHINVWSGKEKGPHFTFDATESEVTKLQSLHGCH
ncbi:polymorphic toxin-type HINT domain-containing protein [Kribbella sp. NPDC051587]|uniref:polymorphic toxin-type HINT domain-containing protein n=1 Tax=Kribbella sp. NPDC051587 TaxID=3364119 RepID=UPI003788FF55